MQLINHYSCRCGVNHHANLCSWEQGDWNINLNNPTKCLNCGGPLTLVAVTLHEDDGEPHITKGEPRTDELTFSMEPDNKPEGS